MILRLAYVLVATILLAAAVCASHAHDAPSGKWTYPYACCGNLDCHPVACDEIDETPAGATWHGIRFEKFRIYPSQDRQCHACVRLQATPADTENAGICLFTQQGY